MLSALDLAFQISAPHAEIYPVASLTLLHVCCAFYALVRLQSYIK